MSNFNLLTHIYVCGVHSNPVIKKIIMYVLTTQHVRIVLGNEFEIFCISLHIK